MPRNFTVPEFYKSPQLVEIKRTRKEEDPKKKDLSPSVLNFNNVTFKLARHFGFCFGVENAIDIAYKALERNKDKRIFLLSEIIHNPEVNADLISRGIKFLMQPDGSRLIDFKTLNKDDIVIVPAFGTTIELQQELTSLGINPYEYDTTCPFVQKVWKRAAELGEQGFAVIIHGKRTHEETRATFSHSKMQTPTLVILDKKEANLVCKYIRKEISITDFKQHFKDGMSEDFDPEIHLKKVGVVNQTTMLATETQEIANSIREALISAYGEENIAVHFADTKDTLCYATYENQTATISLIEDGADIAIVVGGYNSSNTSHLVEIAEKSIPTYYIKSAEEILDGNRIRHFDLHHNEVIISENWLTLNKDKPLTIAITSGASCPDRIIEEVIEKIRSILN
ncbi:MAG: 4-hydroxy-3-methylbut-2-enyl diphosphate reductase [Proteobacteria bacterium]|nr:4-hydroxy-3-methylbut-2-enyl diphosphate reductase [Pseudomonadota bacterium]